jgi:hypothetical protein
VAAPYDGLAIQVLAGTSVVQWGNSKVGDYLGSFTADGTIQNAVDGTTALTVLPATVTPCKCYRGTTFLANCAALPLGGEGCSRDW